jgi:hypothetical protein
MTGSLLRVSIPLDEQGVRQQGGNSIMMTTNIERTEGHYEAQEVEFGRVYRWYP